MGGPFLVPLVEQLVSHLKGVHLLGRDEFRVDKDEVVSEVFSKVVHILKPGRVVRKAAF